MSLTLKIIRKKQSFNFKLDSKKPNSFDNNWNNNSIDDFILAHDCVVIFKAKVQTVANYCFGKQKPGDSIAFGDTVSPGGFIVKCFVSPRKFHGEIHAITNTKDIDGQWIDHTAMQTTKEGYQNGRWLIHDRYSFRFGRDTNYAWSSGCFIMSSKDLKAFNTKLKELGVKSGDKIQGFLTEEN